MEILFFWDHDFYFNYFFLKRNLDQSLHITQFNSVLNFNDKQLKIVNDVNLLLHNELKMIIKRNLLELAAFLNVIFHPFFIIKKGRLHILSNRCKETLSFIISWISLFLPNWFLICFKHWIDSFHHLRHLLICLPILKLLGSLKHFILQARESVWGMLFFFFFFFYFENESEFDLTKKKKTEIKICWY